MGKGRWKAQNSQNKYAGRYANDSDNQLESAKTGLQTYLRNSERNAIMAADRERSDVHLDSVKELNEQYAELQNEFRKRGMNEDIGKLEYTGYQDAINELSESTERAISANNGLSASFVYAQLNMAERALNKELSFKSANADNQKIRELQNDVDNLKKRLTAAFNS